MKTPQAHKRQFVSKGDMRGGDESLFMREDAGCLHGILDAEGGGDGDK